MPPINLTTVFFVVIFYAVLNTGLYLVAEKWGWVERYELNKPSWAPKKCEFCLYFWMALVQLIFWYFVTLPFDWFSFLSIFGLALCAAVISRYLQQ